jgi:hypothetical protein
MQRNRVKGARKGEVASRTISYYDATVANVTAYGKLVRLRLEEITPDIITEFAVHRREAALDLRTGLDPSRDSVLADLPSGQHRSGLNTEGDERPGVGPRLMAPFRCL